MPIIVLPELFAFVVTDVHAPTVIASCAFLNSARFHGTDPDLQLATWWKTRASGLWTAVDGHVHRGNHRDRGVLRDSAIGL